LEARLPKLAEWVKAKEQLPAQKQIIISSNERIQALTGELATIEKRAEEIATERIVLIGQSSELNAVAETVKTYQNFIKGHKDNQSLLHIKIGGLQAKLDALAKDKKEAERIQKETEPAAKKLTKYQTLAKAFGFDGIPFNIVRSVVPELAAMSNDILGQMTGGKMTLEMRTERVQKSNNKEVNALEIWITDFVRGSLPYLSRSGGQKVKAALSVAFALADLKARRAGIQLGFLFVDEPSFLDAEGTEAYCDALELLSQRYPNMKVLAISHDERMKARFPQTITVTDTGENGSKIAVA
jgi:exonuclease SbcC